MGSGIRAESFLQPRWLTAVTLLGVAAGALWLGMGFRTSLVAWAAFGVSLIAAGVMTRNHRGAVLHYEQRITIAQPFRGSIVQDLLRPFSTVRDSLRS